MRSKKTVYNIVTNVILELIVLIYGFIVPKAIISNFGSNVNGLISSITQFLGYITLLESGFGPVVKSILYKPIAKKDKKQIANILRTSEKFFRKISLIFLVYIFILAIAYPLVINKEFNFIFTASLIIIISINKFAEYYFGITYRLFIQAEQKSYINICIKILSYLLSISVIIFSVKMNYSIHTIYLLSGLMFTLRPILQNVYIKKRYNLDLKNADENYKISQKWDGLAQHIASVIHTGTDVVVLTLFCSLIEVSVYSVYYLVVKGVKTIIQSFSGGIDAAFGNMMANKENKNLNHKFNLYEIAFYTTCTIAFSCTIILIVPFVSIYTKNIHDANYIRYLFGVLIVLSEYVWAIRLPYSTIVMAAGHFKETKIGAWIECLSNIVISVILVQKFGLIGVAIGTIIAMTIRTIEYVYHCNKYILKRTMINSIKKITLIAIETIIIVVTCKFLPYVKNVNYLNWIINSIMTLIVSIIITLTINFWFYNKEYIDIVKILKRNFFKKNNHNE